MGLHEFLTQRVARGLVRRRNNAAIAAAARQVAELAPPVSGKPIVFFKASTGIDDLSWNSGFHLLASWALRLQGIPVIYFACHSGMSRCVLGTNRDDVQRPPPCRSCIHQSATLYTGVPDAAGLGETFTRWFEFDRDAAMEDALRGLRLQELMDFTWAVPPTMGWSAGLPLGKLCMPGLRWILRRHNLDDNDETRFLIREYILSAWNVARRFTALLEEVDPRAVVLFNGQFFPEATARYVAMSRGIRVITHEVGLQPASAFFTDGEATAYPIHIPEDFELNAAQNARLDEYLERRFQGKFSMAGIQFWPSMRGLDQSFLARMAAFRQVVPVFTNVVFDTSQPHANTIFPDMFAWLDEVLAVGRGFPETLFVIRAHPDETRTRKESRETVQEWVRRNGVDRLPNFTFVAPTEYLSSYELIQRAKFVAVYNSTIGLEASIMGKPVLCGGRARFTQYPIVFFPASVSDHEARLREFLTAESIDVPADFQRNARRFLYYQLFRTSLPFDRFLMPSVRKTQTRLKSFSMANLRESPALRAILRGLLEDGDFLLEESAVSEAYGTR